jgi:NADPH-dependent 2,4-dienoyl-CoA reductase/sulfur reductase-like enzyme
MMTEDTSERCAIEGCGKVLGSVHGRFGDYAAECGIRAVCAQHWYAGQRPFEPPQHVWVHAMGHWYAGHVVSLGRKRYEVEYVSGAGVTRRKFVGITADMVRPRGHGYDAPLHSLDATARGRGLDSY